MAENQTLAVMPRESGGGVELYSRISDPLNGIQRLGEWLAKSGMAGCDKLEQGIVLAWECFATGKSPTQITRKYHIMDGKLSMKALGALADFNDRGGTHKWINTGEDGKEAVLELTLNGNTIVTRFTIDDAKRMGLVRDKSNWIKSPANMLRARCASNGVAMLCPGIYAGDDDTEAPQRRAAEPLLPETVKPVTVVAEVEKIATATEAKAAVVKAQVEKLEAEIRVKAGETQVIDVQPEPAAEDQIPGAEVPAKPVETPAPAAEPFTAEAGPDGRLSVATQSALIEHIGCENIDAFYNWNVAQNRLKKDQDIGNLSVKFVNTTLRMPRERILAAIKGAK
jgi:hypothetical protein